MSFAILDAQRSIVGIYAKLNPFLKVPEGGCILPADPPEVNEDVEYAQPISPVPEGDAVTYAVVPHSQEEKMARINSKIDAMERKEQLPRPTREFMLLQLETIAAGQGITPEQLRTSHYAYRRVKEFDEAIAALRSML